MAPERQIVAPGRAHAPRELPRSHQSDVGGWPLPARVVRQIQREVARAGRSLQRLEVRGAVIDNFDALGPPSPPSPRSPTPASCRTPDFFTSGEVYQDESMDTERKVNTEEDGQGEDNDLTSLTWLQDRNLLRSINFSKTENDELRPISAQSVKSEPSPTSDYQEESVTWEPADSSGSSPPPTSPPHTPLTPPQSAHCPTGTNGYHPKPNGSASKLKHPHNVAYNPLVHTQNKPPYSFSCLIFMAIEDSAHKALPVKEIYAWIVQHFPYFRSAPAGWKNSVRHNLSLNKCFQKVEKAPSLGKGSLWMVDDQYRSNLLQAFSRSPFHPCVPPAQPTPAPTPQDSSRLPSVTNIRGPKGAPNPQLFPFLSRRLAASEPPETPTSDALSGHDSCDSLDEVVVAAMVLALKHGPGVLPPSIVSSYANQDHTYSAANGRASPEAGYASDEQRKTAEALLHLAGVHTTPQIQQAPHRPRLLRMPPKRSAPSTSPQHGGPPPQQGENNNQPGLPDHNLPRAPKRPRHHNHPSKHHHQ